MSTIYRFGSQPVQEYSNTAIGENEYFVRLDWNQRTADWRISLQNVGTQEWICTHRRLTPASRVTIMPDGQLFCEGPEVYKLEDLGDTLVLRFFTTQELADFANRFAIGEDPTPRLV